MNSNNYYGNIVRNLFIAGGIVMFLTYPFLRSYLPQSPLLVILGVAFLSITAGLTNPKGHFIVIVDIAISLFAVIFFENHAILFVKAPLGGIFLTDQILTIIFFFALYFSVKTFQGMRAVPPKDC